MNFDRLANGVDRAAAGVERSTLDTITGWLRPLENQLLEDVRRATLQSQIEPTQALAFRQARAQALIAEVNATLDLLDMSDGTPIPEAMLRMQREGYDAGIQTAVNTLDEYNSELPSRMAIGTYGPRVPLDQLAVMADRSSILLRGHSREAVAGIQRILAQELARGSGVGRTTAAVRRQTNMLRYQAERIVRTETMSSVDGARRQTFERNGIEFVQRIATNDGRVCANCLARDGNVYRLSDNPSAVLHPNDRCVLVPWREDWPDAVRGDDEHRARKREALKRNRAENPDFQPDDGPTYWERQAGKQPPEPVFAPGFRRPRGGGGGPVGPAPAPTPDPTPPPAPQAPTAAQLAEEERVRARTRVREAVAKGAEDRKVRELWDDVARFQQDAADLAAQHAVAGVAERGVLKGKLGNLEAAIAVRTDEARRLQSSMARPAIIEALSQTRHGSLKVFQATATNTRGGKRALSENMTLLAPGKRIAGAEVAEANVKKARKWLGDTAGARTASGNPLYAGGALPVEVYVAPQGHRAWAMKGVVTLSPDDTVGVIIHEFAHNIEDASIKIKVAAREFLERRTAGEKAQTLNAITNSRRFRPDEVARPDKFFDPYIGKEYRGGATEVVSMGVQEMYENPARLLEADPEHFDLIVDILTGNL